MLDGQRAINDKAFLEEPLLDLDLRHEQALPGFVVGAYRLTSRLGEGGMGTVWLAERCDGRFEGRAAVKFLNAALMGPRGEERFRREGSILARLSHPNIGRLIDAGVSSIGAPYLVLEYIDGDVIDQACDARRLGIDARLALFRDVLAAVAHAHANLVVHRDLKPANVLVTKGGQVKLLDFGIAKLVEPDIPEVQEGPASDAGLTRGGALTREGIAALTPGEQHIQQDTERVHIRGGGYRSTRELLGCDTPVALSRIDRAATFACGDAFDKAASADLGEVLLLRARILRALGRTADAQRDAAAALTHLQATLPADAPQIREALAERP